MRGVVSFDDFVEALEGLKGNTRASHQAFRRLMLRYYELHGRSFPWRETRDPYRILVSEVMLQQTQTHRVAAKYPKFIKKYRTIRALAQAPQNEVLKAWAGLGYYRRARNLHRAAIAICEHHNGRVPYDRAELRALPGIGDYTAAAISTFAHGNPAPMIETNIRSVYLHGFFRGRHNVSDREILAIIEETLEPKRCREWFYALMDFGVELKKARPGINTRSRHYHKQSPFEGSDRQIAAQILRQVLESSSGVRLSRLQRAFNIPIERLGRVVRRLIADGLVQAPTEKTVRAVV